MDEKRKAELRGLCGKHGVDEIIRAACSLPELLDELDALTAELAAEKENYARTRMVVCDYESKIGKELQDVKEMNNSLCDNLRTRNAELAAEKRRANAAVKDLEMLDDKCEACEHYYNATCIGTVEKKGAGQCFTWRGVQEKGGKA
jgi:septal ring factor EnvC (AmiA/AmiB activator)